MSELGRILSYLSVRFRNKHFGAGKTRRPVLPEVGSHATARYRYGVRSFPLVLTRLKEQKQPQQQQLRTEGDTDNRTAISLSLFRSCCWSWELLLLLLLLSYRFWGEGRAAKKKRKRKRERGILSLFERCSAQQASPALYPCATCVLAASAFGATRYCTFPVRPSSFRAAAWQRERACLEGLRSGRHRTYSRTPRIQLCTQLYVRDGSSAPHCTQKTPAPCQSLGRYRGPSSCSSTHANATADS